MAALATQKVVVTGTVIIFANAGAGGDTFTGGNRGVLRVKNGSGAPITATVVIPGNTAYGQPAPDIPLAIAAGAEADFGPFDSGMVDATGNVTVTYSATASVTVAYVES